MIKFSCWEIAKTHFFNLMMLLRRKALRQAQCDNDSGKLYNIKFYRG